MALRDIWQPPTLNPAEVERLTDLASQILDLLEAQKHPISYIGRMAIQPTRMRKNLRQKRFLNKRLRTSLLVLHHLQTKDT
jgi:hypothetical protein